jgi:hypothetical protein
MILKFFVINTLVTKLLMGDAKNKNLSGIREELQMESEIPNKSYSS